MKKYLITLLKILVASIIPFGLLLFIAPYTREEGNHTLILSFASVLMILIFDFIFFYLNKRKYDNLIFKSSDKNYSLKEELKTILNSGKITFICFGIAIFTSIVCLVIDYGIFEKHTFSSLFATLISLYPFIMVLPKNLYFLGGILGFVLTCVIYFLIVLCARKIIYTKCCLDKNSKNED